MSYHRDSVNFLDNGNNNNCCSIFSLRVTQCIVEDISNVHGVQIKTFPRDFQKILKCSEFLEKRENDFLSTSSG